MAAQLLVVEIAEAGELRKVQPAGARGGVVVVDRPTVDAGLHRQDLLLHLVVGRRQAGDPPGLASPSQGIADLRVEDVEELDPPLGDARLLKQLVRPKRQGHVLRIRAEQNALVVHDPRHGVFADVLLLVVRQPRLPLCDTLPIEVVYEVIDLECMGLGRRDDRAKPRENRHDPRLETPVRVTGA